jgi:hypothetical protein
MSGSITHFLAEFSKGGIAKASHFDVMIPGSIGGKQFVPDNFLTFRCEAAEIPGRQLNSADIKIYGPIYKTPFQSIYQETTLTFIETATMDIRLFMEQWMDLIQDSETNALSYPNTYCRDIEIRQYDMVSANPDAPGGIAGLPSIEKDEQTGKTKKVYQEQKLRRVLTAKLYDAFPTNINQMTTAWSDDSPHRLQVTFFYRYYSLVQNAALPNPPVASQTPTPTQVSQNTFSGDDNV